MCTVIVLRQPGEDWPLILAANRDESLARPWKPPARHWPDREDVTAGMDEVAGGAWLGINENGVIAAMLNRRGSLGPAEGYRSRGELPLEALDHADAADAADALGHLDTAAYRPFNMVIADNTDAFWLRHAGNGADGRVEVLPVPPGLSMITASDRNDKNSARIRTYLPRFQKAHPPNPTLGDWEDWRRLLGSRIFDPDEGPEGAMSIVTGDQEFGTVSSSLMALPAVENEGARPIWLFAPGRPDDTEFDDVIL